ncbi:MAG: hypothetical protein Q8R88_03400, partial [Desulfoprunum sp.]|nr:hypothetical protein [Desulfoprunum sp.]
RAEFSQYRQAVAHNANQTGQIPEAYPFCSYMSSHSWNELVKDNKHLELLYYPPFCFYSQMPEPENKSADIK